MPRFFHEIKTHVTDLFAGEASEAAVEAEPEGAADHLPDGVVRLQHEPVAPGWPAADAPRRLLEERRLDPHREAIWGYERTSA